MDSSFPYHIDPFGTYSRSCPLYRAPESVPLLGEPFRPLRPSPLAGAALVSFGPPDLFFSAILFLFSIQTFPIN